MSDRLPGQRPRTLWPRRETSSPPLPSSATAATGGRFLTASAIALELLEDLARRLRIDRIAGLIDHHRLRLASASGLESADAPGSTPCISPGMIQRVPVSLVAGRRRPRHDRRGIRRCGGRALLRDRDDRPQHGSGDRGGCEDEHAPPRPRSRRHDHRLGIALVGSASAPVRAFESASACRDRLAAVHRSMPRRA